MPKTEEQFESQPSAPIDFFEVRMRDLLNFYLVKECGENYWEEAIPRKIREKTNIRIQEDLRIHPYKEAEYIDCRERLDFFNIIDYLEIIHEHWPLFQNIFGSRRELKKHLLALNEYRNMIKHIRKQDVVVKKNGEGAILWFERMLDRDEESREETVIS